MRKIRICAFAVQYGSKRPFPTTILDFMKPAQSLGFTADKVKELCQRYHMDYEKCKSWYDGYEQRGFKRYNPKPVVNAMELREQDGYPNRSSTYMAIVERIHYHLQGTKKDVRRMLSEKSVDGAINDSIPKLAACYALPQALDIVASHETSKS